MRVGVSVTWREGVVTVGSVTVQSHLVYRFFFQAEDGIRDHCVTGVQTCALPISLAVTPPPQIFAALTIRSAAPHSSSPPMPGRDQLGVKGALDTGRSPHLPPLGATDRRDARTVWDEKKDFALAD